MNNLKEAVELVADMALVAAVILGSVYVLLKALHIVN
jgi:hypothetical protein